MNTKTYTESEVISLTSQNIHNFYSRNFDGLTAPMAKEFVWIGSGDLQWANNLETFETAAQDELQELSVLLSDEEYYILVHERSLWVVYGRYCTTTLLGNGQIWPARVRVTYVWREEEGHLTLLHIHSSNSIDFSPETSACQAGGNFFNYIKSLNFVQHSRETLTFRDSQDNWHRIHPVEVIYIKAANQWCRIYTFSGDFLVRGGISLLSLQFPQFLRTHRSYLVNPLEISSLCRYRIQLKSGKSLPVSKDRYMSVKSNFRI
ncbi:MAG: LytTR family transcriptional regulator [Lacrimispora sp.]|uniref:LytTR family transcriptional regulator DNA-binding domain-containing protein n=1 Tax=Lacrimispora sp. TaxID=2719234 RepID=UPI0039E6A04A